MNFPRPNGVPAGRVGEYACHFRDGSAFVERMVRLRTRPLRLLTSLLAVAFLLAPSADAQRKKPAKKKPAAAAKHKPAPKAAAPAASQPAAPAEPAAPEPEPEPEPMPAKKPKEKSDEAEPPLSEVSPEEDKGVVEKDKPTKMGPLVDAQVGLKGFQRHLAYQR